MSYYPNLAIRNKICAEHLPKDIFLKLYEGFFEERKKIPKKDPRNYILKILLNATYGLSNDKYSFLRDRKVTLSICINGQLLLAMLMERMTSEIPECQLLMMNTDGYEVRIPRKYEDLYNKLCKEWEELTKLQLEFVDYSKMVILDVNNYLSISTLGKVKTKGRLEFENIPLHKNKSFSIIPKAFCEYFVNGKPIEETIRNHKNIFDFCAGVRAKRSEKKGNGSYELHWLDKGELKKQKLSKTVRYFISTHGKTLYKTYEDGSIEHVEAPKKSGKINKEWRVTYFNKAYFPENFDDYKLDFSYYISKTRELIDLFHNENLLFE